MKKLILFLILCSTVFAQAQSSLGLDDNPVLTTVEASVLDTFFKTKQASLAGKKVAFISGYRGKDIYRKSDFFQSKIHKIGSRAKLIWLTAEEKESANGYDALFLAHAFYFEDKDRAYVVKRLAKWDNRKKNYFPIWTYHHKNININGVSVGFFTVSDHHRYTNTNGVKLELIGVGVFLPLMPRNPVAQDSLGYIKAMKDPISEVINGVSLSLSGSACECVTNGISLGTMGQINRQVNGFSASLWMNFAQKHNGIQLAGLTNESYKTHGVQLTLLSNTSHKMRGVQVGLVNHSKKLKGFQFGLWNVNDKRSLPLINWSF